MYTELLALMDDKRGRKRITTVTGHSKQQKKKKKEGTVEVYWHMKREINTTKHEKGENDKIT